MIIFILLILAPGAGESLALFTRLDPSGVVGGFELWRLFTYPLAPGIGSLLLGSLAFGSPAEGVEDLVGTRVFGYFLLGITLVVGLVHLVVHLDTRATLGGMIPIGVSIAVAYLYLYPRGETKVLFIHLRRSVLAGIIIVLGLLLAGLEIDRTGDFVLPLYALLLPALGTLVWFHLRYQKYDRFPRLTERLAFLGGRVESHSVGPRPSSGASAGRPVGRHRMTRERQKPSPSQRADMLLDKIARKGIESLTDEEREFLDDYSRRI